ncbi:MAG: hypothetical protein LQ346_007906 [Caloplaca aetnensis]|nr:MAG: hypothetical protein LQ346_007906 [Caloplaca aetnensis]
MKEGVTGFMKGLGKGTGGAMLKPLAAACALPGYAVQGIYKELQNKLGPGIPNSTIAARTAQVWRIGPHRLVTSKRRSFVCGKQPSWDWDQKA